MAKERPCKLCPAKRYGNVSWCRTHWFERKRKKQEETKAKRLERKQRTKTFQLGILKEWKEKTWSLMSKWVRIRDADENGFNSCFTCDRRIYWKELQAGHRYHRRLDYDERNIWPQCRKCNMQGHMGLHGNLGEYEHRLAQRFGPEWVAKLKLDANTHQGYSLEEVKRIHQELKDKLKTKNIHV